jgi:hypothetical protein
VDRYAIQVQWGGEPRTAKLVIKAKTAADAVCQYRENVQSAAGFDILADALVNAIILPPG